MTELADYGPGYPGDTQLTALARLQQAWYRKDVLDVGMGVSPNTKGQLQSYLPAGKPDQNFLSTCAFDYAEERLADKASGRPELTIVAGRLRYNMLSSQPMCFNLFADLRAEVEHGDGDVRAVVAAMFPAVSVTSVDAVIVEEVPQALEGDPAFDKTGWDAVIHCNDGEALITIETKYTDHLDSRAPARGNDALFEIARRYFTKDGLDYYRTVRRAPPRIKKGQPRPPVEYGGFDQVARNLLLTLRYAEARGIDFAVNYVLAPAFDTEAKTKVDQLRLRLKEPWRERVQYRTLDDVIQTGLPHASPRLRRVFNDFTTRYLNLNPARELLGMPVVPYPPLASNRDPSVEGS